MDSKRIFEYIGQAQCPICTTPIHILYKEYTDITLDRNGVAQNHNIVKYVEKGYCPCCKSSFDVVKDGLSYKIRNELEEKFGSFYVKPNDNKLNPFGK